MRLQVVVAFQGTESSSDPLTKFNVLHSSTPPSTHGKHLYPSVENAAHKGPMNKLEEMEAKKRLEGDLRQPGALFKTF
jgi:hypothetical protein